MTTRTYEKELDPKYQRDLQDFVGREVVFCVSSLIDHYVKSSDFNEDEVESLVVQDDYESAVEEYLYNLYGRAKANEELTNLKEADNIEDFAIDHDIEPYQREAYEHWIVTSWLAEKLQAKGEMVLMDHDFLPTPIWGRTTTGQGIASDRVIMDIYDELQEVK